MDMVRIHRRRVVCFIVIVDWCWYLNKRVTTQRGGITIIHIVIIVVLTIIVIIVILFIIIIKITITMIIIIARQDRDLAVVGILVIVFDVVRNFYVKNIWLAK